MQEIGRLCAHAGLGGHRFSPQRLGFSAELSSMEDDDLALLGNGMMIFNALFAGCRDASHETHTWTPGEIAS
ncbi:hypothetical protein [Hoeflea sp.]|uniref:hypothetical protein n=1 Tax=Hoeflea sp. TaxID=1940281 RepID=UPI003A95942B